MTYAVPVPLLHRRKGAAEALRQQCAYKQIMGGIGAMLGRDEEAQKDAYRQVQLIVDTWEGRPLLLDWDATQAPAGIDPGAGLFEATVWSSWCGPHNGRLPPVRPLASSFSVCQPAQREVSCAHTGLQQPRH